MNCLFCMWEYPIACGGKEKIVLERQMKLGVLMNNFMHIRYLPYPLHLPLTHTRTHTKEEEE